MRKFLIEVLLFASLFFLLWLSLRQIDWMEVFHVEKVTASTEEKLGDLFWEMFSKAETEIKNTSVNNTVDTLVEYLCDKNNIDFSTVKIHILKKADINAFTLPNRHLCVFSGLIENCENQEELIGILGHEIAHMEKSHVMKKLMKEAGLGVLISMTSGKGNPETARQLAKLISSSAYDRKLETEADMTSVDYMIKAQIDPEPFANFLYRLGDESKNIPNQVFWISTHPESRLRAEAIIEYIKGKKIVKKHILTDEEWGTLQEKVKFKKEQ